MLTHKFLRAGLLALCLCLGITQTSFAQLILNDGLNATQMAQRLSGSGVSISNAMLICPDQSSGSFTNGGTTNIGLNSGLALTTGCLTNALGPNSSNRKSCPPHQSNPNLGPGDADLAALAGFATNDACILEFDLVSIGTEVSFEYVFASEEYPEFVCSQFNDIFAFFVSGPNPKNSGSPYNKVNIAIVPGTTNTPVAINSVNPGSAGSQGQASDCISLNHASKYRTNTSNTIEYDGFTIVLTAKVELVPCQTYRFRLGVADGFDNIYDSAVFLEEGSFKSNLPFISHTKSRPTCPGECDGTINIEVNNGTPPFNINWSTGATTNQITNLCAGNYTVTVTDDTGCEDELTIILPDGVDVTPPVVNCPSNIDRFNDPGDCAAKVNYTLTATDNCSAPANITITSSAPSGSTFAVGTTNVSVNGEDEFGNVGSCSFTITVRDNEAPVLECPENITINCEDSIAPSNTGELEATDNCLIASINQKDVVTPGVCPQEKTILRTWTVKDIHENIASCSQTITVIDTTRPVIICPDNIVVTCDTTTANTGFATATDNCDPVVVITYADQHVSGDCKWNCLIDRTFTAVDDCGNTNTCVQRIEKNVLPLIEKAIAVEGDGLLMGVPEVEINLLIPLTSAACILEWMPGNGTTPNSLLRPNQVVDATCNPGTNPRDKDTGQLSNPLFAAGLHLQLYLLLDPDFGKTLLEDTGCPIAPIIMQSVRREPTVDRLMHVTHEALSNRMLVPHRTELLEALQCIIADIELCDAEE